MSDQITTAFVQQYKGTLYNLVQQKGSRLREAVTVETVNGEAGYFDQIGATAAIERTSRHSDSPLVNTPHSRRQVTMRDFEWGDLIDNPDKVRLLVDPSSNYLQSAMWALGRKVDDIIIEAALGPAKTGKTGTVPAPFLAGQKVAVAATGLTVDKLLQAKELLDKSDVDPDDPRFVLVTAKQITNLLGVTAVTSSDFNTVKALAQGQIDTFLGFKFIRTQRLTKDGSNNRQVIAWAKSGVLLALGSDIKGRVIERPDKSFSVYAYASLSCGATRMEEEKVVEIACLES
jgi:hypothetical protein